MQPGTLALNSLQRKVGPANVATWGTHNFIAAIVFASKGWLPMRAVPSHAGRPSSAQHGHDGCLQFTRTSVGDSVEAAAFQMPSQDFDIVLLQVPAVLFWQPPLLRAAVWHCRSGSRNQ